MTVAYLHHLQSSGLGFYRILFLWAGSIYKGIWRPLFAYCLLYSFVTLFYREILLYYEDTKETFERFCVYANQSENHLPLNFILGFYVTQVQHLPSFYFRLTLSPGCQSMVEPILLVSVARHICHEPRVILSWTGKGVQGFLTAVEKSPNLTSSSSSIGAEAVCAIRQLSKYNGLEEVCLDCFVIVS